jgi:hypothetical protein
MGNKITERGAVEGGQTAMGLILSKGIGSGFILIGRIWENVIGFEAINERLCKIRLKSKYNNLILIK